VNGADGLLMLQSAVQWFTRGASAPAAAPGASRLSA
jgi:hypothetical protein